MPFFANTPEALLGRNDSKNPGTTCRGITGAGRPCRRPLSSPSGPPPRTKRGHLRADDPRDEGLYCWQHRDQASMSAHSSPGPRTSATPILEERTSLDTLADRLGLLDVSHRPSEKPPRESGRVTSEQADGGGGQSGRRRTRESRMKFCFCFSIPVEETSPPPRPRPRPIQTPVSASAAAAAAAAHTPHTPHTSPGRLAPSGGRPSGAGASASASPGKSSTHSSTAASTSSRTATYLALIPPSAPPQTASQLMAELAKPFSPQDEAGYIYMFWLTPESQPAQPPAEAARSLLAPPSSRAELGAGRGRRPSDVLESFANNAGGSGSASSSRRQGRRAGEGPGAAPRSGADPTGRNKTILLKIGRATNVQRRLNEWTRQCGYNLSLIRYYPYVPSSGGGGSGQSSGPRKVPHSHKVERLVHIELAGMGVRVADGDKCEACGREHREWFEVAAHRQGVMEVDEVIRRWVDWDEGNA